MYIKAVILSHCATVLQHLEALAGLLSTETEAAGSRQAGRAPLSVHGVTPAAPGNDE